MYGRQWGFRFEDIAFNALYLWHGGLDTIVPVAMGLGIAGKLAHCQAVFYPEEGHFSVIVTHGGEIMTTLIS